MKSDPEKYSAGRVRFIGIVNDCETQLCEAAYDQLCKELGPLHAVTERVVRGELDVICRKYSSLLNQLAEEFFAKTLELYDIAASTNPRREEAGHAGKKKGADRSY